MADSDDLQSSLNQYKQAGSAMQRRMQAMPQQQPKPTPTPTPTPTPPPSQSNSGQSAISPETAALFKKGYNRTLADPNNGLK